MNLSEVRKRAWETRRRLYGPRGHRDAYACRGGAVDREIGTLALRLVVRLHREGTLSEGQCCRALRLHRVAFRQMCDEQSPTRPAGDGDAARREG